MKKLFIKLSTVIIFIVMLFSMPACSTEDTDNTTTTTTYNVSNNYFTVNSFSKAKSTSIGVNGNSSSNVTYEITMSITCSVSLTAYTINAKFYSETNTLLDTYEKSYSKTIAANTKFTVSATVDETTYNSFSYGKATLTGKSYSDPDGTVGSPSTEVTKTYTVTLVYNNGNSNGSVKVTSGSTLTTPADPEKTNYIFTGWYTTSSLTTKYDFSKAVNKDFTIYAGYELDATTLTNKISTTQIKSIVTVYNKCYNTFLGITTEYETHQGSGFCFQISNGYYYILTNCHVASLYSSYSKQKFTIEDYQGNEYTGYLYQNSNKTYEAIAASYDLACLYFKSTSTNVTKLNIGSDPEISDDVISVGTPSGQTNYITYGNVKAYQTITLSGSTTYSNVTFDVIRHTATISSGCSGGPLLDANLNVVGVNYASSTSNSTYHYAIPASKVNMFLKYYVYN